MVTKLINREGKHVAPLAPARASARKGAPERSTQNPDLSEMAALVAEAQKKVHMIHGVDLSFTVHKASGETMVTVKDEATGKVIREIPSSDTLDLAAKIDEMIGIIFDQKG